MGLADTTSLGDGPLGSAGQIGQQGVESVGVVGAALLITALATAQSPIKSVLFITLRVNQMLSPLSTYRDREGQLLALLG